MNAVRVILSDMPPDADILTWLQGRLSEFHEATPFFEKRLQKSLKEKINMVHSSSVAKLRDMLLKTATDEQARQYIIALTDEQVRTRAIETVQSYFVSIFEILHSDKSAEQKRSEIEALANYKPNIDLFRASMNIYNEFGGGISSFITGIDAEMTEEQKLSEIQKIIEKSAEPNAIKSLTMFSDALKKKIDFGFIADNKITNDQKLLEMKKALKELANAFALETSTFGIPAYIITGSLFKSHIGYEAQVNSTKAAVEIYLVTAKTGKLPEKLPDYLPKDPYTGEAFEYETSGDGFVLRCRDEDKTEFKFKIRIGE
ncbi:MAG: hypothetical protein JW715_06385 [Sedimentisphaerales bacterium]|nr:hypothetical protein [Sedimentisphaerales bacterium]